MPSYNNVPDGGGALVWSWGDYRLMVYTPLCALNDWVHAPAVVIVNLQTLLEKRGTLPGTLTYLAGAWIWSSDTNPDDICFDSLHTALKHVTLAYRLGLL